MTTIRFLLGLGLLLTLTACPKQDFPISVPIGFLPDVTITPSRRTMQRGDTLWLEANFSDSLLDKNSGQRYRVRPQDLKFVSGVLFRELLGVGQEPVGIASTFRIVEKVGRLTIGGATSGIFEPVYDGRYYRARVGLIPTSPGIAAIQMTLFPINGTKDNRKLLPFIQLPPDAEGRERRAVLDNSFYIINEGKANNFDLNSQYVKTFATEPGTLADAIIYETKSQFTVEVK
jgi:hypothetical protein